MEKFNTTVGCKTNIPTFEHLTENCSSSENRKNVAQLQNFQDVAVYVNLQARKGESNQLSRGHSGGATEMSSSEGRIKLQYSY